MTRIFLDHNATTPIKPTVREAMIAAMDAGNPSSVHAEGRAAKLVLETARRDIADVLNAPAEGTIFTGGGTEAINMALWGMARRAEKPVRRIYVSAIEHDATLNCAKAIAETGLAEVTCIPVSPAGEVDAEWLLTKLSEDDACNDTPFLVAIMLANNETGVLQNIEAIRAKIFELGGFLFVDAAQAVGKLDVSFSDLQADFMSIAAHKFGGPKGAGALLTKPGIAFAPLMQGGGQELRRRPGTENMIAIAGIGAAVREIDLNQMQSLASLRDRIETYLLSTVGEVFKVWGDHAVRLPNTTCFSAPGFSSETQVMTMDLSGIAVSSGSACSSGKVKNSHVLTAMGATEAQAQSALRVSLGWDTTPEMVDAFIARWCSAYERIENGRAA